MRRSLAVPKHRPLLVTPIPYAAFITTAVVGLALLYPQPQLLDELLLHQPPSPVSLAYLRGRLAQSPDHHAVRLTLARHLLAVGELDEAARTIQPLLLTPADPQALLLGIEVRRQQLAKGGLSDQALALTQAEVVSLLTQTIGPAFTAQEHERLASWSLEHQRPDLASSHFARLADQDPSRSKDWLIQAARWALAGGDPHRAGALALRAFAEGGEPAVTRSAFILALQAYEAAGDPETAYRIIKQHLHRLPPEEELLDRGIRLAMATRHYDDAQAWGRERLARDPRNPLRVRRQLEIELATGNVAAAYPLAVDLVRLAPDDPRAREYLAKVAEWSGHVQEALTGWLWLVHHTGRPEAYERAFRLAVSLNDYPTILALLRDRAIPSWLDKRDLEVLVNALASAGGTSAAQALFRRYFARHPNDTLAWRMYAVLLEQFGNDQMALAAWNRVRDLSGDSVELATKTAGLLWRLRRSREALARLLPSRDLAQPGEKAYWELLGEVAWTLRENGPALHAYRILWAHHGHDLSVGERLVHLTRTEGHIEESLGVSRHLFQASRKARHLLGAMHLARDHHRWDDLRQLLAVAGKTPALFSDQPGYWHLRGSLAAQDGRLDEALASYQQALALDPLSAPIKADLLWLLVNHHVTERLPQYLAQWQDLARDEPSLWEVYAAGYTELNRPRKALPWYARLLPAHRTDYLWILTYADALQQAGRKDLAHRLRKRALLRLWPDAVRALLRGKTPEARPLVLAYAGLVEDFKGEPASWLWMQGLLRRDPLDPVLREVAVAWHLDHSRVDAAKWWLLRRHAARIEQPPWQQLVIALADNDLVQVSDLLDRSSRRIPPLTEAEAASRLGEDPRAARVLAEHIAQSPDQPPQVFRQLASLQYERTSPYLQGGYDYAWYGSVGLEHRQAEALWQTPRWHAGLRYVQRQFHVNAQEFSLGNQAQEHEVSFKSLLRWARSHTRLTGGVNARTGSSLPFGGIEQQYTLRPGLTLQAGLYVNEMTLESSALRVVGAKDRAKATLTYEPSRREYVLFQGEGHRYHSRESGELGQGYALGIEAGHRLSSDWRVMVNASTMRNEAEQVLPSEVSALLPTGTPAGGIVPTTFSMAGAGTVFQRGDLSAPMAGHVALELWGGWVWPADNYGYLGRLAIGHRLFGQDDLTLNGWYANFSPGGAVDQAWRGVGVTYTRWLK